MKLWKCPECEDEKFSKDNIIIKVCYVCQVDMEEVENGQS